MKKEIKACENKSFNTADLPTPKRTKCTMV